VSDLERATEFYESLLPPLGFTERYHGGAWKVWATADPLPDAVYFAITERSDHAANDNRIAFGVSSDKAVDRIAAIAREAGADVSDPKQMPYSPGYYAAYFDDPSGNAVEVYHRPPPADAEGSG